MIYVLEGNIGAGKSTFLSLIRTALPHVNIVQEPVAKWLQQSQGDSLLENFYLDPKRWAFSLETYTMVMRMLELQKLHQSSDIIVMERSLYSGHYCFAQNGFDQGFFNPVEWNIYQAWANFFLPTLQAPSGFIYLQSTPEICMQRIAKRNRTAETSLTLDYVTQIHEKHELFLVKKSGVFNNLHPVPVLTLPVNDDFEHNNTLQNTLLKQAQQFMGATSAT